MSADAENLPPPGMSSAALDEWAKEMNKRIYSQFYAMGPFGAHTLEPDLEFNSRREALWAKLPKNPFIPPSPEVQAEYHQFLADFANRKSK